MKVLEGDWQVPTELIGKTVAAAVRALHGNMSWSEIRDCITRRCVVINGVLCLEESRRVVAGDRIELMRNARPSPSTHAAGQVFLMDESVIVIEKPTGMISLRHAGEISWPAEKRLASPTLDEVVLRLIGQRERSRMDLAKLPARRRRSYLRSVHRLDRETSGLIIFARTIAAEENLVAQFASHSIDRIYRAMVLGHPEAQTVSTQFVRDRGDGLRGSTTTSGGGKLAVTHIRPLERIGDYSLVECQLETGRTHQIRIHLTELGFPVCGDSRYRSALGSPKLDDLSQAPRLALHAHRLAFDHPDSGQRMTFEAPLPRDLQTWIAQLRLQSGGTTRDHN